jgi:uncharacterized integral membrane protein
MGTQASTTDPSAPADADTSLPEPDVQVSSGVPTSVKSTRASRAWLKVLPAVVLLAAIVMFVVQNSRSAKVSFAMASGRVPLAVALLASAALGALFVLAVGSIRILQLRKMIRRSHQSVR